MCKNSQENDNTDFAGDNSSSQENIDTESEYESTVTDDESENSQQFG